MIRTDRIGHVVLKVHNLERSRKFYTEVLGLDVMAQSSEIRMVFLASNRRDHHEIALVEVGADAQGPLERQVGLAHVAFRLTDREALRAAYHELKERQVPIAFTVYHGITESVYFYDPDGNQLELYCDVAKEQYEKLPNPYMGMDQLDFAPDSPSVAELFARMRA